MKQERQRRGSGERVRVYGWVVILVCVGIGLIALRSPILHGLSILSRPFVGVGTWVNQHTYERLSTAEELRSEKQALEAERLLLAEEAAKSAVLEEENTTLRALLQFSKRRSERSILASVVARSLVHQSSKVVIDRGAEDGVQVGYPVLVAFEDVAEGQGILIGKVTAVTARSATVTTLTDPALSTAATIVNRSRTIGVVSGIAGTLLSLQYVPQEEELAVNQLVLTSGLEPHIPSGLVIGLINAVYKEEAEPFQQAIVEPLGDARRLSVVSVLIPEGE